MQTYPSHFREVPHTRPGRWAVGLMALFVLLFAVDVLALAPLTDNAAWDMVRPIYAIFILACGLGAGVSGLLSLVRAHERSWLAWLALAPGVLVLFLLVIELFFPH